MIGRFIVLKICIYIFAVFIYMFVLELVYRCLVSNKRATGLLLEVVIEIFFSG